MSCRIALVGGLAVGVLAGVSGLLAMAPRHPALRSLESPASLEGVLPQLELADVQEWRIREIRAKEQSRIRSLQEAFAETTELLREAETTQPFDEALVSRLVERQAEISACLRGTESRVVSEIVTVLTPEQRRAFVESRSRSGSSAVKEANRLVSIGYGLGREALPAPPAVGGG